ncbi:MAG: hypothetical protein QXP81_09920 [Nitrososphaerota archaeon]
MSQPQRTRLEFSNTEIDIGFRIRSADDLLIILNALYIATSSPNPVAALSQARYEYLSMSLEMESLRSELKALREEKERLEKEIAEMKKKYEDMRAFLEKLKFVEG